MHLKKQGVEQGCMKCQIINLLYQSVFITYKANRVNAHIAHGFNEPGA